MRDLDGVDVAEPGVDERCFAFGLDVADEHDRAAGITQLDDE